MLIAASAACSSWAHGSTRPRRASRRAAVPLATAEMPVVHQPTPYLDELRSAAIDGLTALESPSTAALAEQGEKLSKRAERGLLLSCSASLLTMKLANRWHLTTAVASFGLVRLVCAALSGQPEPRRLVPWTEAGQSAARALSLWLQAVFLGSLGLLIGLGATTASAELAGRVCWPHVARLAAPPNASVATAGDDATAAFNSSSTIGVSTTTSMNSTAVVHEVDGGQEHGLNATARSRWWRWRRSAMPVDTAAPARVDDGHGTSPLTGATEAVGPGDGESAAAAPTAALPTALVDEQEHTTLAVAATMPTPAAAVDVDAEAHPAAGMAAQSAAEAARRLE